MVSLVLIVFRKLQSQKSKYRHAVAETIFWLTSMNFVPLPRIIWDVKKRFAALSGTPKLKLCSVDDLMIYYIDQCMLSCTQ